MARWLRLVDFRPRELGPEISAAHALGSRGDSPRGAGSRLRRSRDRRGVRGGGQGPDARPVGEQAAVGGGEPAAVRMLARAVDAEGRERLRHVRPAAPGRRAVAARLAAVLLLAAALAGAGCGDDSTVSGTDTSTSTVPTATTPAPASTSTTPSGSDPSSVPQAPGEGDGTGGAGGGAGSGRGAGGGGSRGTG